MKVWLKWGFVGHQWVCGYKGYVITTNGKGRVSVPAFIENCTLDQAVDYIDLHLAGSDEAK